MTEIKLDNNVTVILYNSIKELPIDLSKKFNHFMLQVAGIGNTYEDIDDHLARLTEFAKADKKDELIEELKNMRFNFFAILDQWDFRSNAFACLVKSVNGLEVTDRSDEGLEKMITYLSENGLTNEKAETTISEVKKNLQQKSSFTSLSSLETIGTT